MPQLIAKNISFCNNYIDSFVFNSLARKRSKKSVIYIQKRTLMRAARQVLFHQEPKFQALPLKKNMVTWTICSRIKEPIHGEHLPLRIDTETGYEIMSPIDFSGKNHHLLTDIDYKSDTFYKIYGTFTTKSTFFNHKPPLMVSAYTLEGKHVPQFFHHYDVPKLIEKSHVLFDDLVNYSLTYDEYQTFLKAIKA